MDDATYHRLLTVFTTEMEQQLGEIGDAILVLAKNSDDAEARGRVASAAHTIRSDAATLGLRQLMIEAQHLELWATRAAQKLSPAVLARLHESRAVLRQLLAEVAGDSQPQAVS